MTLKLTSLARLFALSVVGLLASSLAHAQAFATAVRPIDFSVFGGATLVQPDYGPQNNRGYLLGGEVNRYWRLFDPGVDFRFASSTGDTYKERFLIGDLKLSRHVGRFARPYVTAGVGYGVGGEVHGFQDNSIIYGLGGGLDLNVSRSFAVRGDFQHQMWRYGNEVSGLTPNVYTASVLYRIHLRER